MLLAVKMEEGSHKPRNGDGLQLIEKARKRFFLRVCLHFDFSLVIPELDLEPYRNVRIT